MDDAELEVLWLYLRHTFERTEHGTAPEETLLAEAVHPEQRLHGPLTNDRCAHILLMRQLESDAGIGEIRDTGNVAFGA